MHCIAAVLLHANLEYIPALLHISLMTMSLHPDSQSTKKFGQPEVI